MLKVRYPFAHRPWQREIEPLITKWTLINAHRGSGKSWYLCHKLIEAAMTAAPTPGKVQRYAYVGMSMMHAKQTVWDVVFKTLLAGYVKAGLCSFNGNDLTINFYDLGTGIMKSQIVLSGYDTPERNRGMHLHGMGLDEAQACPPEVWQMILAPTTAQHQAWVIMIGTPNGPRGLFYDTAMQGLDPANKIWTTITRTVADTGEISDEAFDRIKAGATADQIRQEYYCSFDAAVTNRVYHKFDVDTTFDKEEPITNLKGEITGKRLIPAQVRSIIDKGQDLWVGMDFNIGMMVAVVGQKAGSRLEIIAEIVMKDATTDMMCERIKKEYPNRRIIVCPDASGANRTTQTLDTNHLILKRHGFTIRSPRKNPDVSERVEAVNVLLENASGLRRLFIDKKCAEVISTLRFQQLNNGKPDKKAGYDHAADALGYLIWQTFPFQRTVFKVSPMRF